jgi:hypothetical protein
MRTILAAVALATALHATSASAQESHQQTEDRERRFRELDGFRRAPTNAAKPSSVHGYQGMYFRPDLGVGYMSISAGSARFSGPAGSFGLHFGGALSPDVLLGVHFYESFLPNPTASGSVAGLDTSGTAWAAAGIGPELTVCLPADLYIASTVALTRQSLSDGTTTGTTKAGVGAKFALGFDRWADSGKWSVGAAVQASYSRNQYSDADRIMLNTWMIGAALSAAWD